MKKIIIGILVTISFVIAPQHVDASLWTDFLKVFYPKTTPIASKQAVPPIPVRELTIDTLNKSIFIDDTTANRDGRLYEYVNNVLTKNWKIKYEWKGHSRKQCDPPVLNLSFDKADSKGNPRPLFNGRTTYQDHSQLEYQKIRMIPDCDIWNDYWLWSESSNIGFNGKVNVLFREYLISDLMRYYGVPTADVIGFANVRLKTSDPLYNDKIFKYLIIQRPQEQDDQIPFTKQFNLSPTLFESGESGWSILWDNIYGRSHVGIRPTVIPLWNQKNEQMIDLTLDPEVAVTMDILTNFLTLQDMALLHNEDYGIDKNSGRGIIIPHGFDASFGCVIGSPYYLQSLNNLPDTDPLKNEYKIAILNSLQRIFNTPGSLDRMLASVDAFPYDNAGKDITKEFLLLSFYHFSTVTASLEFAEYMGIPHKPLVIDLPFSSHDEFRTRLNEFQNSCRQKLSPTDNFEVSVNRQPTLEILKDPMYQEALYATFDVAVTTKEKDLLVIKQGAFEFKISSEGNGMEPYSRMSMNYSRPQNIEPSIGPYYTIPPNTTAVFKVEGRAYGPMIKDQYQVFLTKFQPNSRSEEKTISENNKTNIVTYGIDDSAISVISPNGGEILHELKENTIRWSGGKDKVQIGVVDSRFESKGTVLGWISLDSSPNGSTIWNGYTLTDLKEEARWRLKDLSPGPYKIIAKSEDSECYQFSPHCNYDTSNEYFTVESPVTPPVIQAIGPGSVPQPVNCELSLIKDSCSSIRIISPNSGSYEIGKDLEIIWGTTHNLSSAPITLWLTKDNEKGGYEGGNIIIAENIANTGIYTWKIPLKVESHNAYRAHVQAPNKNGVLVSTRSDKSFSITSTSTSVTPLSITITSPRSSPLQTGFQYKIIWVDTREKGATPLYYVGLTGSNGKEVIAYNVSAQGTCSAGTCVIGWTPTVPSSGNQIFIYDTANDPEGKIKGKSKLFDIKAPPYPTVTPVKPPIVCPTGYTCVTPTSTPTLIPYPSSESNLTASCYTITSNPVVGQTVYWQVAQSGGASPFSYNWIGTDGLSSGSSLAVKSYSTAGTKSATVTIKSPQQAITASCSTYVSGPTTTSTPAPTTTSSPSPTATPTTSSTPTSSPTSSPSESPSSSPEASESPMGYSSPNRSFIASVFYSIGDFLDAVLIP